MAQFVSEFAQKIEELRAIIVEREDVPAAVAEAHSEIEKIKIKIKLRKKKDD